MLLETAMLGMFVMNSQCTNSMATTCTLSLQLSQTGRDKVRSPLGFKFVTLFASYL